MRAIPFGALLDWALEELATEGSVFGIPRDQIHRGAMRDDLSLFGEGLGTPVGPAAGPNTQLAQNIVASWLGGARFFELKTVQVLDELEFDKPCILAGDECYNTEWSTELSVEGAYEEYIKGWMLLHVLQRELGLGEQRDFVFNMSVGYDLKGIQTEKVDRYIEGMKDASEREIFRQCKEEILSRLDRLEAVDEAFVASIEPHVCRAVTLSTMHGCPPEDIESISRYLLSEKGLHTMVKMNPTLLGYETVRQTFDEMGYGYIALKKESFTHDLQYDDGMAMLRRLKPYAEGLGLGFGVKLSNTLPTQITRGELPGEEMYMSGRSLYPLTVLLASRIAAEFDGTLRISYSGGADQFNARPLLEAGVYPITVATTILKPGGYMRLSPLAQVLADAPVPEAVDVEALRGLAGGAPEDAHHLKDYRPVASRKIDRKLPLLDCYLAPCTVGCPIEQDIPEYLGLVHQGRYDEAFSVITQKNPLPGITGTICDHQCMFKCTRLDYDESLEIRAMKKVAFDQAARAAIDAMEPAPLKTDKRAVVIGAGPAGLAAAWFLRRSGMDVTVREKEARAGGTVTHVIPEFRIAQETAMTDVEMIERAGVRFEFGVDDSIDLDALKDEYDYVFLAIGATRENTVGLAEGSERPANAVSFLRDYRAGRAQAPGRRVVVAGAGNTAMDTARAAKRLSGVEDVAIVYRRTVEYMPADAEELDLARADGVRMEELLNPVSWKDGVLTCEVMELGEPDESGRRRPVGTGTQREMACDLLISSIGEKVDDALLAACGIACEAGLPELSACGRTGVDRVYLGGDARRGPATVVQAIADATASARHILDRENIELDLSIDGFSPGRAEIWRRKGNLVESKQGHEEGGRCLACSDVCAICTEVCPNRANVLIEVDGRDQILHVDGMCNECGNCQVFCPWDGAPYKDKFTLFWSEEDFEDSENRGFLVLRTGDAPKFKIRLDDVRVVEFDDAGRCDDASLDQDVASLVYQSYRDYPWLFPA